MGKNTFKSLPKVLPNRDHIVLSYQDFFVEGVTIFNNFNNLLTYLNTLNEDVYIIGGASIYELFLPYASELILTEIDKIDKTADVYFPKFNKDNYVVEIIKENIENNIKYKHIRYRKKEN